jgi:hypothetical protein
VVGKKRWGCDAREAGPKRLGISGYFQPSTRHKKINRRPRMKNKYRRKGKESKRLKWTMAKFFLEVDLAYLLGGLAG